METMGHTMVKAFVIFCACTALEFLSNSLSPVGIEMRRDYFPAANNGFTGGGQSATGVSTDKPVADSPQEFRVATRADVERLVGGKELLAGERSFASSS